MKFIKDRLKAYIDKQIHKSSANICAFLKNDINHQKEWFELESINLRDSFNQQTVNKKIFAKLKEELETFVKNERKLRNEQMLRFKEKYDNDLSALEQRITLIELESKKCKNDTIE